MSANPMTHRMQLARSQGGTSLVEILIAMVIALFIMTDVVIVFVNMQKSFTSQDQPVQLQDNERPALTILTNVVQQAGYFPNPTVNTALSAFPANGSLAADQVISSISGTIAGTDTVITRFVTANGDGTMNCLGQTNTTGARQVYIDILSANANNKLQCAMMLISSGVTITVPLVSGVTRLSVLYGTDTNSNGYGDSYLTTAQMAAPGYWSQVHTAQVTLTFTTQFGSQVGQAQSTTWVQNIDLKNQS